jgi:hypothetical protein
MEHDLGKKKNLKLILSAFEAQIKIPKRELFCFGTTHVEVSLYAELFGCEQDQFPISYLGMPF